MTLSDYSQNPELMAHFAKPKFKPFRHIKENLSGYSQNPNLLAYFENPNILSCEMPMGRISGPCTFCNGMLYSALLGINCLTPSDHSINQMFCSVDLILPLKSLNTSRILLSLPNGLALEHCSTPSVTVSTLWIPSLKHRTIGLYDSDHFLMHLNTGLNPEAAESMELCFSMNDSYSVDIECISMIVLSDYPFCSSG
ncbi:hypothetical protein L2E82_02233 [Cichorium intybus]|uniref:Uncharacterized protein n=1 Tax=Cichorium intybus TaxID=13427 RepID=A0ACB9H279_CICIN|nr:hypothetical protein L2E82_02233 [Cichorium intybus]